MEAINAFVAGKDALGVCMEQKVYDALLVYSFAKVADVVKNKYLDHVCKTDVLFIADHIGYAVQVKTNDGYKYTEPIVSKLLASKEAKKYNIERIVVVMLNVVGANVHKLYAMDVDSSSLFEALVKNASKNKITCRISYDGKTVVTGVI